MKCSTDTNLKDFSLDFHLWEKDLVGGTEDNSQMWQKARGRGRREEEERGEEEDRQRSFQRKGHLRALPMGTWKWKERQL